VGGGAVIVLDTHTLVWWVAGDPALSKKAKTAIERELAGGEIIVSAISAWEIAMLVEREKLVLSMDVGSWLATVSAIEAIPRSQSSLLSCLANSTKTRPTG
jgi:PIN domain nuclease of toxin-antitoxin system